MIVVDSSALAALLLGEPERQSFVSTISAAADRVLSAASYVEVGIVVDRRGSAGLSRGLDQLLDALGLRIAPVTASQARIARDAYRDYGKGSQHPAQLNFGDCLVYALAIDLDAPLLFKGNDFAHTDVRVAVTRSDPPGG